MSERRPFLHRSSYAEVNTRFGLLSHEVAEKQNVHTYETDILTLDGKEHRARISLYWPGVPPAVGSCISSVAMIGYDEETGVVEFSSSKEESEPVWGNVSDDDYIERNIVKAWRIRACGEVVFSEHAYFIIFGIIHSNGVKRTFRIKCMINRASNRWQSFVCPRVGDLCGTRGKVESIVLTPTRTIVIALDSYSGPDGLPYSQVTATPPKTGAGSAAQRWREARERVLRDEATQVGEGNAEASTSKRTIEEAELDDVGELPECGTSAARPAKAKGRKAASTTKAPKGTDQGDPTP
ncbi:hypothetical protein OC835_003066 [Tilletia horrida]|uniref:Uncharacterized protein n=1 Tax=Tilletia horrida TaxID=155126 RepID=A0AAN6G7G3_9BASI|nr:hypothetical protein OC842_006329 [Tilletia horrida]KAK0533317.1 hypothetical protein OC835_003066 [Tilletia horrida]